MNYTLNIAPGQTMPLSCGPSTFFCVVLSAIDLEIRIPGEEASLFAQGDWRRCNGHEFTRLEVRNPSTADVKVIIFAGNDTYGQQRQAVIEPKTRVVAKSGVLAGSATIDLTPVLGPNDIRRKHVVISNPDSSLRLELLDETGTRFEVIEAKDSHYVQVSEKFFLSNPNGADIEYALGEVYWCV